MTQRYRRLVEHGECAQPGVDPELFNATDWGTSAPARALCRKCTVIEECELEMNPPVTGYLGVAFGKVWVGAGHYKVKELKPK